MRRSHFYYALVLAVLSLACTFQFQAQAAPPDENVLQFEDGYLVETVVEGNAMGVVPYNIRLSEDGELFAVDEVNSNVVKITPPLSQYSRARLVAGSFQGYTGHIDGKPNEARFNHPKGLTMDDKGNIYVADTMNHAIRKIGDAGVTTIAGGKSNVPGFRDGPSGDAKFSNDFDVVYVHSTCSLLVVDRRNSALRKISLNQEDCDYQSSSFSPVHFRDGPSEDAKFSNDFDVVYVHSTCSLLVVDRRNAALRKISLNQEDCDYQSSSFTMTDALMVIGAVLIGYAMCMLQLGFGSSSSSRMQQSSESEYKEEANKEKPILIMDNMKEEPKWPSFGQLFIDLSKLALEALVGILLCFVPSWYRPGGARKGLTPLKDSLIMPDDEVESPSVQRQTTPAPAFENRQVHTPTTSDKYSEMKPPKIKSASFKDPSPLSKHRTSKQQEYAEFYGSGEVPSHGRSKSHKEKSRHRQRDRVERQVFGAAGVEPKPAEMNPVDYSSKKIDLYNNRSKYGSDSSYRF